MAILSIPWCGHAIVREKQEDGYGVCPAEVDGDGQIISHDEPIAEFAHQSTAQLVARVIEHMKSLHTRGGVEDLDSLATIATVLTDVADGLLEECDEEPADEPTEPADDE